MKARWKVLIAVSLAAPAGLAAFAAAGRLRAPAPGPPAAPPQPPRPVRVQEIREAGGAAEQSYTGVVRARYESNLAFRVGGQVVARQVEIGQRVRAGQPLFRLDSEDYELAVKAAEADLVSVEAEAELKVTLADYERHARLLRSAAISASEFDKRLSERDVAVGKRDRVVRMLPWLGIDSPTAPWRPTPTG